MTSKLSSLLWLLLMPAVLMADQTVDENWSTESPRDEIRPIFSKLDNAGPGDGQVLAIQADSRRGLMGAWTKSFAATGNQYYQFSVWRKTSGMQTPRRAAVVRLIWLDDAGNRVFRRDPSFASYRPGEPPRAEPEFPADGQVKDGWTQISGIYRAPPTARRVRMELHFRWGEPESSVQWTNMSWQETQAPPPRIVRLATAHLRPRDGKTPAEKRAQFKPLIEQAAKQNVDLLVLPETLTYYGTGSTYADIAEPIPGPSTEYFGKLAQQHDMYIVAGLIERDQHLIYNVSVLIGPDQEVVGKYRKVTLPRGEIEGGVTPGNEYPVFDTRFGKVGMMVCYDGFFPEVARELSNRGAEVIAWPVWGCNPMLGAARACENHVYLISSTYTDRSSDWMISAIYGHDGRPLKIAEDWGTIAVTQVDLNKKMYWHSLGDFHSQIQRHRPVVEAIR